MDLKKKYEEGCYLIDRRNYTGALKTFNEILKEDSKDYYALNKMGVSYAKMGSIEEAEKCFIRAIEINNAYGPSLVNMGNIQMENNDTQGAIEYYMEAIEKDPDNYLAYYNLAAVYKRAGNYNEYIKSIKKYKKIYKNYINHKELNALSNTNKNRVYLTAGGIAVLIILLVAIFN